MAAETITLPGFGPTKRTYVYVGGALVAGIVVYAWWQRGSSAEAAPTPELEPFEPQLEPADLTSVSTGGGVSDTGAVFITTNAQWSEAAIAKMVELGYDSIAVATALGKFLANQPVTLTEEQFINTALALQGKPPVGEHSIRRAEVAPSPSPTPTPTPSPSTRDVPRGDKVNMTQSLSQYARHFSRSTSGDSVEATKRQILSLNPWLKAAIFGPKGKPFKTERPVKAGWIIIVPRGVQR